MQGMTNFLQDLKNENIKTESKTNRSRRKSRWKLKFHHQALPPEYLDHYEASLSKQSMGNGASTATTPIRMTTAVAKSSNWKNLPAPSCTSLKPASIGVPVPLPVPVQVSVSKKPESCTVRYTDLPYMGEMTLDNARPRRGRKPKKADICHLIYKNYGTTVLDEEPLNLCVRDQNHLGVNLSPVHVKQPEKLRLVKSHACDIQGSCKCSPAPRKTCSDVAGSGSGSTFSSNNEVSMCKFKFTGGPVPILQEKKMLSVDFTGNLKYSLGNSDAFKSNTNRLLSSNLNRSNNAININKRKSRKSLAREKLEQTFKEKGFLIQTQQLESDQGATYCKFRQLRKFTRYLFRSWKHHLPGEVVETPTPPINSDTTDPT